jgi:hypothetical protein
MFFAIMREKKTFHYFLFSLLDITPLDYFYFYFHYESKPAGGKYHFCPSLVQKIHRSLAVPDGTAKDPASYSSYLEKYFTMASATVFASVVC